MGNAAIGDAGKPGEGEVDSDVFLGSSPLSAVDVLDDDEARTAVKVEESNGGTESAVKDGDGDVAMAGDDGGVEEEEDDQPVRSRVSSLFEFTDRRAELTSTTFRRETRRGRSRTSKQTTRIATSRTSSSLWP